jgi:MYXO-CTERM domain-containing protein
MMMHRYFLMKCLFALSCGLLATLLFSANAAAVDIENSGRLSSFRIEPVGEFFDLIDSGQTLDQIALVNREQCVKMYENNTPLGFYFTFSGTYHSARVFAVPTRQTPDDFSCDLEATTHCNDIENIDEFRPPTGVNASVAWDIEFGHLVNVAVDGLQIQESEGEDGEVVVDQANNGIRLLRNPEDCNEREVDQQYFIRLLFESTPQTDRGEAFDAVLELDTKPPAAPDSIGSVVVTETNVFANWELEDTDDLNLDAQDELRQINEKPFVVFASNQNITGWTLEQLQNSADVSQQTLSRTDVDARGPSFSGSGSVGDLNTGTDARVWIAIASRDDVGNLSEPVFPEGDGADNGFVPVAVVDFWEDYKGSGGQESGGCNAVPGAPAGSSPLSLVGFAALGLGLLGWRRRRRLRRLVGLTTVMAAFGVTLGVSADAAAQSPTWGMAEIRFGGYFPSIDDEEGLGGQPFQNSFGSSNRVLFEYEQGIHLIDAFGALGASASIGYTHFGGDIEIEDDAAAAFEGIEESTGFMVVPVRAGLYYRIDQFEKTWDIPLVPVVKAGFDYVLWQAEAPNGDAATAGGDEGEGGTYGWHASAGLHLLIDWLEPTSAAAFDYNWGVNNTYAFAEYMHMQVDDFGSSDSFNLSDNLWMFGLAFEY